MVEIITPHHKEWNRPTSEFVLESREYMHLPSGNMQHELLCFIISFNHRGYVRLALFDTLDDSIEETCSNRTTDMDSFRYYDNSIVDTCK